MLADTHRWIGGRNMLANTHTQIDAYTSKRDIRRSRRSTKKKEEENTHTHTHTHTQKRRKAQ